MSEETPVKLKLGKRRKSHSQCEICVIHDTNCKSFGSFTFLTDYSWNKILAIAERRKESPLESTKRTEICSNIPGSYIKNFHGYHRECYQSFTNVKYISKQNIQNNDKDIPSCSETKKRKIQPCAGTLFAQNTCMFCDKETIYVKRKKHHHLAKCLTEEAKSEIHETAKIRKDPKILGFCENYCLIAREARYHEHCRKKFLKKSEWRSEWRVSSQSNEANEEAAEKLKAHEMAFTWLKEYVEENIIGGSNVERMSMLREKYLTFLQEHYPEAYNAQYKTDKLKHKLVKEFGSRIKFWKPSFRSELVYSDEVPKGLIVESAFESASSVLKRLEEAALILRRTILDESRENGTLPWPPSASDLQADKLKPPNYVIHFMSHLLTKKPSQMTVKEERLARSIGEDICYNVTKGTWKQPKHILLGMSIRHLTGSAELVTLLNRFGHCISYSATLEIETAICNKIKDSTDILPPNILKNKNLITHFCWDNFDLVEETLSGAGTTHSTHGIIIQEVNTNNDQAEEDFQLSTNDVDSPKESFNGDCEATLNKENRSENSSTSSVKKQRKRSVNYVKTDILPCNFNKRAEPPLTVLETNVQSQYVGYLQDTNFLWMFYRLKVEESKGKIPGWSGWLCACATSKEEKEQKSIIEYLPPINEPITKPETVQEVLRVSMEATREINQAYTFITCDLAVARMAYLLIWQNPQKYKSVIVRMGAFHTKCCYMSCLGKLIRGSGFEEIIIESGICASGSIEKVMSGKHYNRATRVHITMLEALERLLFKKFEQHTKTKTMIDSLKEDLKKFTPELHDSILEDDVFKSLHERYLLFREEVAQGLHGLTSQFWLRYMDKVWHMLDFSKASKTNDVDAHIQSLQSLCPLFFAMDHQNYARYTSAYLIMLINLKHSHPGAEVLLRYGGISVCKSNIPAARTAVDMTIEQTINRQAKCKGGIIGFSKNLSAYHRWCVTRHTRAAYFKESLERADMDHSGEDTHKEQRPSKMKESEESVQKVLSAFTKFINPFDVDEKDDLICLSSGMNAPESVCEDLTSVDSIGQDKFEEFIEKRLKNNETLFHFKIKRVSIKTFESLKKQAKLKSSNNKNYSLKAQRNILGQLLMLTMKHSIDLEKVMSFPLSPIPFALGTPDGLPMKTDKSVLLHLLDDSSCQTDRNEQYDDLNKAVIIDGNALFHTLSHNCETFSDLSKKIFSLLPDEKTIHFVTDAYKANSIKCAERLRRASCKSKPYLIRGASTKVPKNEE